MVKGGILIDTASNKDDRKIKKKSSKEIIPKKN
jgi:hypothetical protein